jgi:hypothetical protein
VVHGHDLLHETAQDWRHALARRLLDRYQAPPCRGWEHGCAQHAG